MARKILYLLLIGVGIASILSILFLAGIFSTWQEKLSDNLFTQKTAPQNIVIIAIDDTSLSKIGQWPWNRSIHAKLLNILNSQYTPPAKIGLDISFFEPTVNDTSLGEALKSYDNVVLASEEIDNQVNLPLPAFLSFAKSGVVNTHPDTDGVTRKIKVNFANGYTHFASETLGTNQSQAIPLEKDLMRINFVGKPGTFTTYSYTDVLDGTVEPNAFANKIVLVGATAIDLHDNQIVPTSSGTPMSGVEIHANAISTLMSNAFLVSEDSKTTVTTIILMSLILTLVFSTIRIRNSFLLACILLIGYFVYSVYSFDQGTIRNLIYPPLAILTSLLASIIFKYQTETRQKRFLRLAFSHYVSEEVVKEIVNNPEKLKLGGERKEVTVLFSDIEGFTTISEKIEPEELTTRLNDYLTHMTKIILDNKGVVDKFIGDSVMAFWGAPIDNPNHALDACRTALEMQKVNVGDFHTRIGINTGEAIVGNMGSDQRFDYTVLGDTVNLASRLEGQNKNYGTKILISESTYKLVEDKVEAKLVDTVTVKGKTKATKVYELIEI